MSKNFIGFNLLIVFLFFLNFQIISKPKNKIDKNYLYFMATIKLLKIPESMGFDVYYNGKMFKVKGKDNSFKVSLKKGKNLFNVLFVSAENISFESEQNTIKSLVLKKTKNYKFFQFNNVENNDCLNWKIKQINIPFKFGRILIPDDTIIVPLDPNCLKINIENIDYKKNSKIGKLPIINIEPKIEKSKFEEQIAKSCLAFINLRPFHRKEELKNIKKSKSKVAIIVE